MKNNTLVSLLVLVLVAVLIAGIFGAIDFERGGATADPAMCDHAGILSDPPHRSGWPWILANPRNLPAVLGYGPVDPVTLAVSDYYDNVFFAERITCPVYMSTGFSDDVCFSEGVYKAYNALKGPKQIETNPYNGHCATYNRAGERKLLNQER